MALHGHIASRAGRCAHSFLRQSRLGRLAMTHVGLPAGAYFYFLSIIINIHYLTLVRPSHSRYMRQDARGIFAPSHPGLSPGARTMAMAIDSSAWSRSGTQALPSHHHQRQPSRRPSPHRRGTFISYARPNDSPGKVRARCRHLSILQQYTSAADSSLR